ncbi:hypothetical protein TIFTF001_032962 [Ficus carica]|uniref:Uncharacterized protein n=1 Tax=Ficus carica TaxID=3494 RepID=A0AA88E4D9_FICCA|nr:hypothetical protein TIFTF001_032962 [Ficus carica]
MSLGSSEVPYLIPRWRKKPKTPHRLDDVGQLGDREARDLVIEHIGNWNTQENPRSGRRDLVYNLSRERSRSRNNRTTWLRIPTDPEESVSTPPVPHRRYDQNQRRRDTMSISGSTTSIFDR